MIDPPFETVWPRVDTAVALLDGDDDAARRARSWIRGALTPYRARLAAELEDVEQQVMMELLENLAGGRFRGDCSLATYVRRMTHYHCLNRLRSRRVREAVDLETVELPDNEPSPFDRSASRQSVELALRVVAAMPEACRDLWRRIHAGKSYAEMSTDLGVAKGTLRVRVLRCREKALVERERLLEEM